MKKECAFCGELTNYELCKDCYLLSKEEYIIKNEKGIWIKNVRKNNEYKFYDENKEYKLKQDIMNEWELRIFNIIRKNINKKYTIFPQVNLQSIISTNSNKRNDELYRNIDFAVFYTKNFSPFLLIELNGQQHYTNEYYKERDKSVKQICDKVGLPLFTLDIKNIKIMNDKELQTLFKKIINYLNPNFFKRLFYKTDKMNLEWTNTYIKN